MSFKLLIEFAFVLLSVSHANQKVDPFSLSSDLPSLQHFDVTMLLPLPDTARWNSLPQGTTEGALGRLMPLDLFKKLPQILGLANNEKIYRFMRVVGIRLDPCFAESIIPTSCQAQIRFVWQPIAKNGDLTSTFDASVHSFYNLSKIDFERLILDVRTLKSQQESSIVAEHLAVHPILAQQGLDSDYAKKLFTTIYKYVGEKNLVRLTFMKLFLDGKVWEFGGFDLSQAENAEIKFSPIIIPRVGLNLQRFKNAATPEPLWFHGGIDPLLFASNDNLSFLLKDSREVSPQTQEHEITEAVRAAIRIENPNLHNSGTVDCVSCHVAQMARSWAIHEYPWFNLTTLLKDSFYSSSFELRNLSPMQNQTNVLRAFGYFLDRPIVSQRVINESADVLRQLNQ